MGTNAAVAGDAAMLTSEVTPVLKALRKNGLDVVAIHYHMTDTRPCIRRRATEGIISSIGGARGSFRPN